MTPKEFAEKVSHELAYIDHDGHPAVYVGDLEEMLEVYVQQNMQGLVDGVSPLIDAARGLSFGTDWNEGNQAIKHGYRKKLLDALPVAIAALKQFQGRE